MRTGPAIARAHAFFFIVINDREALIAADRNALYHLNFPQVIIFRRPAVAVIDLDMTGGCFTDGASRGSNHPRVGSIFPNFHADVRGKIHRAAKIKIMWARFFAPRAVVESVHGNP